MASAVASEAAAGVLGHVQGARGRQWPRWCLSAATVALEPCERENRGGEGHGESERAVGGCVATPGSSRPPRGHAGKVEVARARAGARWPHARRPSVARKTTGGEASGLGRLCPVGLLQEQAR